MQPLGLPDGIHACLFDLDGVLTETASIHFEAWKQTFDSYLSQRGGHFEPFNKQDYLKFVDGKPRHDGVRSFLASRSIVLPEDEGSTTLADSQEPTVQGLGDKKNALVIELMQAMGVTPFEGSRRYLNEAQKAGLKVAVVSASANARAVLEAAGLLNRFEEVVDGIVARTEGLRGKPFPDTFVYAARRLEVDPAHACVFEDALAGVKAARDGGFGYVVGINRASQAAELMGEGADVVVDDLADLLTEA